MTGKRRSSFDSALSIIDENEVLHTETHMKPVRNMDDFLKLGRYCVCFLVVFEFLTLTALSGMIYMTYAVISLALATQYSVKINIHWMNPCWEWLPKLAIPISVCLSPTVKGCGDIRFNSTEEACTRLPDLLANKTCEPVLDYQFKSVNVEFNLFCSDSRQVKNSISYQMIGVLCGALVSGQLSDTFGRRIVLIISLFGTAFFSLWNAYAQTFLQFSLLRVAVGLFMGGVTAVQGVYSIENIPKAHRLWINTVITWSPNFIIYPPIVYFCGDWRTLALFTGGISLLSAVSMIFLFESPRWLIQKGRIAEARHVLTRMREINGDKCEIEAGEMEHMLVHEQKHYDNSAKRNRKYTFYHIVCTWKYLRWTSTICFGIITASLVNYGLLFNMEKISGSLYWNNTFFGIIRWIMNILVGAADYFWHWVGRKKINTMSMALIIAALTTIISVYWQNVQIDYSWVIRYATIGITSIVSPLYLAKFMITNELFPTAIRNLAASALAVSSRVGTICAPQLFYLADIMLMLPYLVLLLFCCVDCIAFELMLPETKGRNLENNLPPKEKRILYRRTSIVDA